MDETSPYILIADDDPDDLLIFVSAFQEKNSEIDAKTFGDGDEILDFLSARQGTLPELIILDYKMPRMSGAEVLRHLSTDDQYKRIPIVIWSTSNRKVEAKECRQLGAAGVFVKPDDHKSLQIIVDEITDIIETAHANVSRH